MIKFSNAKTVDLGGHHRQTTKKQNRSAFIHTLCRRDEKVYAAIHSFVKF
jgi:hypothetical protein